MGRANEDSQQEGVKVVQPQDADQIGADMLDNETAGKACMKRRMGSLETSCEPRAHVGWEGRVKIFRCEVSEEAASRLESLSARETWWRCGDLR